jgi:spore coat polysaccharide biosynthesis protein SpsF
VNVVAIIQARMGSTRLPGKVLMDISGATMLSRVVSRVKQAKLLNQIVVATSDKSIDDLIVKETERLKVFSFRGSENDVLDRYYQAALSFGADVVVRVTSDCPLIEPTIVDEVINAFLDGGIDYSSNTLVRTYPRGLDVEVFSVSALKKAWEQAKKDYQRVHVTPFLYENPDLFKLQSITSGSDYSKYRWTVDTPDDLKLVRRIYELLGDDVVFSWRDIIALIEKHPELETINSHINQKETTKA